MTSMWRNSVRLWNLQWKNRPLATFFIALTAFIMAGAPYVQSWLSGRLLDSAVASFASHAFSGAVVVILAWMIFWEVILKVSYAVNMYAERILWFFFDSWSEMAIMKKRGELDIQQYENPKLLDELSKATEGGTWRLNNFANREIYLAQGFLDSLSGAVVIGIYNPIALILVIVGTIPELIVEYKYGKLQWGIHSSDQQTRRRFWNTRWHFVHIPYLTELKLMKNLEHFQNIFSNLFFNFQKKEVGAEKSRFYERLGASFVSQVFLSGATILIVYSVIMGGVSVGSLAFLLASIGAFRRALSGFFRSLASQQGDNLFVTDVFRFLDTGPILKERSRALRLPSAVTPEIIFENVSFKYPGTNEWVLKNISLTIPSGTKLAIVGINGAGKTSLIKLLCRFYDPTEGRILVGGRDLRDIRLDTWYEMLGILFQEYAEYHGMAVKDAIALGYTGRKQDIEAVKAAAKAGEADVFIEEWAKKYDEELGRKFAGVEPSIGQWQKLALARTFYRDPRVMVLDEPTASIDAEAEAKIFERIEEMSDNRTVILISHRFSTVRKATKIAVIEGGTISEYGTHESLLANQKTYARLFNLQAEGYR